MVNPLGIYAGAVGSRNTDTARLASDCAADQFVFCPSAGLHGRARIRTKRHASIVATVSRRRAAPDECRYSERQENYAEQDAGAQCNDRCGTASFLEVNHHFFPFRVTHTRRVAANPVDGNDTCKSAGSVGDTGT